MCIIENFIIKVNNLISSIVITLFNWILDFFKSHLRQHSILQLVCHLNSLAFLLQSRLLQLHNVVQFRSEYRTLDYSESQTFQCRVFEWSDLPNSAQAFDYMFTNLGLKICLKNQMVGQIQYEDHGWIS
jgi:hypothetical protein